MSQVKLMTLADLLNDEVDVGALATVIEKDGIYGWDRYGRFKHFKAEDQGAIDALDLLADMARYVPEPGSSSPLEESERRGDFKYNVHGWPEDKLPDFASIGAETPRVPRPQAVSRTENGRLAIIGALLDFIEGKYERTPDTDFKSPGKFAEWLATKMNGIPGGSLGNIRRQFKLAREHIDDRWS